MLIIILLILLILLILFLYCSLVLAKYADEVMNSEEYKYKET